MFLASSLANTCVGCEDNTSLAIASYVIAYMQVTMDSLAADIMHSKQCTQVAMMGISLKSLISRSRLRVTVCFYSPYVAIY